MSVIFGDYHTPATTITLYSSKVTKTKKSNNKITPVKNSNPVIVRLGKTESIKMIGRIYSSTDYTILDGFTGETVLTVNTSDYVQLPINTKWLLKNCEITQSSGQIGQWDYMLELESYMSGTVV